RDLPVRRASHLGAQGQGALPGGPGGGARPVPRSGGVDRLPTVRSRPRTNRRGVGAVARRGGRVRRRQPGPRSGRRTGSSVRQRVARALGGGVVMPWLSYQKALNRALADELANDPGVFVLGADS